jgi:hypothetical protein
MRALPMRAAPGPLPEGAVCACCLLCNIYTNVQLSWLKREYAVAGAYGVDMPQIAVAATAVSRQRTMMAEVSSDGYIIGVCLLSDRRASGVLRCSKIGVVGDLGSS